MRVVVAQHQAESLEPVRRILLGMGLECTAADCVPFSELPVRLAQAPTDLVLVRVGAEPAATLDAIRQSTSLTAAPVLALGAATDPQHILQTTRGGAREYLDEDRLQEDLEAALEKLHGSGTVGHGQGRVLAFVAATPGAGVTTVATNVAFALANQHPEQVALAELGRETPDLALNLDFEPRHTVADLAQSWQRLDAVLLRQSLVMLPGGVGALAYKPETPAALPLEKQAVRKLVVLLRTRFAASVLDLGHTLGEEHYEALRLADAVGVIVRLDVPALRQARLLVRQLADTGVPVDRIRPIANRYGQRGQIIWKKAEEALGVKFAAYIPEDSGKLNDALNRGQPVVRVARYASISRRFTQLATLLAARTVY